jgi:hypothetical protein
MLMTTSISKTIRLHEASALWAYHKDKDHLDCVTVNGHCDQSAEELARLVFDQQPVWVEFLMNMRNRIVKPFGLKTGHEESFSIDDPQATKQPQRETVGLFEVYQQSDKEIVLGADDWHLDFRVSIRKSEGKVQLASWVRPHNWVGRIYLALIMPFHHLIVAHSTKRMAKVIQP